MENEKCKDCGREIEFRVCEQCYQWECDDCGRPFKTIEELDDCANSHWLQRCPR
jgi:hypothetical protein